jgi:hypothetical protein
LDRRRQFSLLIVRGDGVRVLRFNFGRPVALGLMVTLGVLVLVFGALAGDYVQLRELTRDAVGFSKRLTDQQQFIDSINKRIAELRTEVAGWRELHARIWEPFGPDASPDAASPAALRRPAAGIPPTSSRTETPRGDARARRLDRCCSARISVGAMMAA